MSCSTVALNQRSEHAQRDEMLMGHIQRIWCANLRVYVADKVLRQIIRVGIVVLCCTVARLMWQLGREEARLDKKV